MHLIKIFSKQVISWKENYSSKSEGLCINPKDDLDDNKVCGSLENNGKIGAKDVDNGLHKVLKAIEELKIRIETNTNDIKNFKQYAME